MTTGAITGYLKSHENVNPVSFHMPGHKGMRFFEKVGKDRAFNSIANCDITEIPGADNLLQPEGIIEETMAKYRRLYDCKETFLLINGSSAGIIGAILACVGRGEKLILGGNSHKSAISGLTLSGGIPIYVQPDFDEKNNISGGIDCAKLKTAIDNHPDAKAVLITSPNYYGICSDIGKIAKLAHDAGMILIVDQAHGAHLKFFHERQIYRSIDDKLLDAGEQGADIVVMSTHKTLASFTQTAIVNVYTEMIDTSLLGDMIHMVQSSSPSYPLMMSLDINADILLENREKLIDGWLENIYKFKTAAKKIHHVDVMESDLLDISKININMADGGIDGVQLEQELMKRNIYVELTCGNMVMAMTGIGNSKEDYDKLLNALSEISNELDSTRLKSECCINNFIPILSHVETSTEVHESIREIPKNRRNVYYKDAVGLICGSAIIPYPPGIPIVSPGETFTEEILEYAYALRQKGQKVLGLSEEGYVVAGI